MTTFFDEIKAYIGFSDADSVVLARLRECVAPYFEAIATKFYTRVQDHPDAFAAVEGGAARIPGLKRTLVEWMDSGFAGPHNEAFYERRARIGRVHVKIGLPQQYMFTAMNLVRVEYHAVVQNQLADDRTALPQALDAINRLLDLELAVMLQTYREDSDERLRRRERLATIGQLAATIGHDLRNPLSVMESSIYLLNRREIQDPAIERHLGRISAQVETCNSIVSHLLEMARNRPPKREPVDIRGLFMEAIEAVRIPTGVEVECEVADGLSLQGDPSLLRQALVNLLVNSVDALSTTGGQILLQATLDDQERIMLTVSDNGPGFDPEILRLVFEPLVTTRAKGTGLGLALVKGIAERHGGSAEAENHSGGGAIVRLRLPCDSTDSA